jgi:hypothetical protein
MSVPLKRSHSNIEDIAACIENNSPGGSKQQTLTQQPSDTFTVSSQHTPKRKNRRRSYAYEGGAHTTALGVDASPDAHEERSAVLPVTPEPVRDVFSQSATDDVHVLLAPAPTVPSSYVTFPILAPSDARPSKRQRTDEPQADQPVFPEELSGVNTEAPKKKSKSMSFAEQLAGAITRSGGS